MIDTFEFTLNNPLTEEQWDMITDVDMDRTDKVTFRTKHGKEVEFVKVRRGKWVPRYIKIAGRDFRHGMQCSVCAEPALDVEGDDYLTDYCPWCGARMDKNETD